MGFKEFLKSSIVTVKLARKPSKQEFLTAIRITLIGIAVIGSITFVIKFLAIVIQGA